MFLLLLLLIFSPVLITTIINVIIVVITIPSLTHESLTTLISAPTSIISVITSFYISIIIVSITLIMIVIGVPFSPRVHHLTGVRHVAGQPGMGRHGLRSWLPLHSLGQE